MTKIIHIDFDKTWKVRAAIIGLMIFELAFKVSGLKIIGIILGTGPKPIWHVAISVFVTEMIFYTAVQLYRRVPSPFGLEAVKKRFENRFIRELMITCYFGLVISGLGMLAK